jgi:hypothetical protein
MAGKTKGDSVAPERRAIVHDLNNDSGTIIAECDLLKQSRLQTEATARINTIKTTAIRMANRLAARRTTTGPKGTLKRAG